MSLCLFCAFWLVRHLAPFFDPQPQLQFEMTPSVSVNFISQVTSYVGLQEEEPQTTFLMSFTWALHVAAGMLLRH